MPTKAVTTRRLNNRCITALLTYFDAPPAPFEAIRPINIRQYLDWRKSKVIANREASLFSHIWNWARGKGITDLPNPCEGIQRNKEIGRDVYVDDDAFKAVYARADAALRDAMDLAHLTGQRVGDVWSMDVRQVTARGLIIKQSKSSNRVTMEITGELAALLDRIAKRKGEKCPNGREKVYSTRLIVDDDGLALGRAALRHRFDKARDAAGIAKGGVPVPRSPRQGGYGQGKFGKGYSRGAGPARSFIGYHDRNLRAKEKGGQGHANQIDDAKSTSAARIK